MLRDVNMNLFTFKMAFFKTAFRVIFYHKQSRVLFCLQEKSVTLSISVLYRHHLHGIKVEKPSEPAGTFQICFWYFISFNMKSFFLKIFKMNQIGVAPN